MDSALEEKYKIGIDILIYSLFTIKKTLIGTIPTFGYLDIWMRSERSILFSRIKLIKTYVCFCSVLDDFKRTNDHVPYPVSDIIYI